MHTGEACPGETCKVRALPIFVCQALGCLMASGHAVVTETDCHGQALSVHESVRIVALQAQIMERHCLAVVNGLSICPDGGNGDCKHYN